MDAYIDSEKRGTVQILGHEMCLEPLTLSSLDSMYEVPQACKHPNESYSAVLSFGAVYCAAQCGSIF